MANVCVTLGVLQGTTPDHMIVGKLKPGLKYVRAHMIFDINVQQVYS